MNSKKRFFIFTIVLVSGVFSFAEVPDFLKRWKMNPRIVSQEIPFKRGAPRIQLFDEQTKDQKEFVMIKDLGRKENFCTMSSPGDPCFNKNEFFLFEAGGKGSRLKRFLGEGYEVNLWTLDALSLHQGQVSEVPWSGYYWPIYEGGIGNRYGDPQFPRSSSFKKNLNYYENNYLKPLQPEKEILSRLSPAEKYDYLLNDDQWTLTQAAWSHGKYYLNAYGKVETWMGICHGWAPAAFMVPEPKKAFTLSLGAQRGELTLYPHDVKALISQLWAEAPMSYAFLGGRCNDKNPSMDESGRITSSACFDVNPMEWHLALTHLVGRNGQSFVLDATYDYEVWNQPIYSYKLSYFHPVSHQVGSLKESIISSSGYSQDIFKKYRSSEAKYLVGVISEIQYVTEEFPYQSELDHSALHRLVTVTYYYDLELNGNYDIIGGEWYQKAHPDMLWKPDRGAVLEIYGENHTSDWNGFFPIPQDLVQFAIQESSNKTPLTKILNELMKKNR